MSMENYHSHSTHLHARRLPFRPRYVSYFGCKESLLRYTLEEQLWCFSMDNDRVALPHLLPHILDIPNKDSDQGLKP